MKYLKPALAIAVVLCSAVGSNAWAQHGHGGHGGGHFVGGHGGYYHGGGYWRGGVFIGAPLFWPYGPSYYDPYYDPGYYYSPPLVVESAPPTYVERSAPAPTQSSTWSYCSNPQGYYPYVKDCKVPWRSVDPASVPAPRRGEGAMNTTMMRLVAGILPALLTACAVAPTGPSAMALPGSGKSFEQFQSDDLSCRNYAQAQAGSAQQASDESTVRSAALGTVVGAALGAAVNGGRGAGVGAGTGLAFGTLAGVGEGQRSAYGTQRRYDNAYQQCMYAQGNRVPVSGRMMASPAPVYSAPAYPPPNTPPPPPLPPGQ